MNIIELSYDQYLEFEKISIGSFAPLDGFMTQAEFVSVVENMRLPNSEPFTLPVTLDLTTKQFNDLSVDEEITLLYRGVEVGIMRIQESFECEKMNVAEAIFGTTDIKHPGVANFMGSGEVFVGGPVKMKCKAQTKLSRYEMTPYETKSEFKKRGWQTVVGFQTRNVPHRAHEYLIRVGLEMVDGLFVQPLVGRKKAGDFTPEAILTAYQYLIGNFIRSDRACLGILSTSMRYAGPREAVFHAIIRRNYGCTHFIVGRDHAGVGEFYGKYDAHDLIDNFKGELGIEVLRFHGPFFCDQCDSIVTEHTCAHWQANPGSIREINGTDMRSILLDGVKPAKELMRPEIIDCIQGIPLFITESDR